jgi:hypothetical protein
MTQFVHMISRAVEAYDNADPKTQKIALGIFVVLIALTIIEQVSF